MSIKLDDNFNQWADAHVFYEMFMHKPSNNSRKIVLDEFAWHQKAIQNSLNGKLLTDNSFFHCLKTDKKIYLAHTTPNLKDVLQNNNFHSSGGCLVGAIYCTPLVKDGGGLRMHNLGKYIFEKEAPRLLNSDKPNSLGIIVFEIDLRNATKNNLIGIDYLRLGKIHFNIYKELEYLLSSKERHDLEEISISRIRRSLEYLSLCNKAYYLDNRINPHDFFKLFIETIEYLPILGYFYFEVLAEYIMLYQNNNQSLNCKTLGEFYSPSYKNLVPNQYPKLPANFSLRQFKPSLNTLIAYLKNNNIFSKLDVNHLLAYITDRIIFLTNARLLSQESELINWNRFRWDFENLSNNATPIVGHIIHRELRSFGRYPNFYFYFDQYKALQIWNYWNHMDIAIPFNGIMPKGEVGINPAYTDLKYKVYTCKVKRNLKSTYLEPDKQVMIKIEPKLVNLKFAFMRSKDK